MERRPSTTRTREQETQEKRKQDRAERRPGGTEPSGTPRIPVHNGGAYGGVAAPIAPTAPRVRPPPAPPAQPQSSWFEENPVPGVTHHRKEGRKK